MNPAAPSLRRVLHLLDTDNFAGTERYVLQQLTGLRAAGVDPILACRETGALHRAAAATEIETWPVWHGAGPRASFRAYRNLKRRLRETPIDILQAHNGRTMLLAAALSRATGVPAIGTQHFLDPRFTTYRGVKRFLANAAHHWVNKRLAHIICVSEAARLAMIRREHVPPEKTTTVHSGIDPLPPLSPARIFNVRRLLGLNDDDVLIVCLARLEAEKSLPDLIAAMPAVLAAHANVKLIIAGDGEMRGRLEAQIHSLHLAANISLLGFRSDAGEILAAADLFVLPSAAEPFGLVLLEAMSLSKPVIACRAGGPAEIVEDGVSGTLVTPASPDELTTAINRFLSDPHSRQLTGAAGRARFESLFTTQRMIDGVLRVYQRVLAGRASIAPVPAASSAGATP